MNWIELCDHFSQRLCIFTTKRVSYRSRYNNNENKIVSHSVMCVCVCVSGAGGTNDVDTLHTRYWHQIKNWSNKWFDDSDGSFFVFHSTPRQRFFTWTSYCGIRVSCVRCAVRVFFLFIICYSRANSKNNVKLPCEWNKNKKKCRTQRKSLTFNYTCSRLHTHTHHTLGNAKHMCCAIQKHAKPPTNVSSTALLTTAQHYCFHEILLYMFEPKIIFI